MRKPQAYYTAAAGKRRLMDIISRFTGFELDDIRTRNGWVEVRIVNSGVYETVDSLLHMTGWPRAHTAARTCR